VTRPFALPAVPASAPLPSRDAVRDAIAAAIATRTPLRVAGRGHWLDAGRPVRADARRLSLAAHAGIVEYTPGDLTLTALAGTPLADLERATAAEGQWLALDPMGPPDGTLGAAIATASSGASAHAFGAPRDNVLGLEFITGTGAVARGGGRVVKNVAGFDLTRLLTGSWGTLGVITEVTVRLRALPAVDETVALAMPHDAAPLAEQLELARIAPIAPWSLELVNAPLARRLGLEGRTQLLVRLAGNEELVAAQRDTLTRLGDLAPVPSAVWRTLRESEPAGAIVVRHSDLPARFAHTWTRAARYAAAEPGTLAHATVGRGIVRCMIPREAASHLPAHAVSAGAGSHPLVRLFGTGSETPGRIFERLPADLWPLLAPFAASDRLSRGVRRAYDPHGILNPGILGDAEG
jgi:glycolate oxidase FAD binding subunit